MEAFVRSPAFADSPRDLVYALDRTTARLPEAVTYLVCECFINAVGAAGTIPLSRVVSTQTISQILLRLYNQGSSAELKSRCLNLIDRMVELGTYELERSLEQYER